MTCVSDFSAGRLINVLQLLIHKEFFYHTAWIDTERTDKEKKKENHSRNDVLLLYLDIIIDQEEDKAFYLLFW